MVRTASPAVYRIWPNGYVETIPNTTTDGGEPLFSGPMGIVGDSKGNHLGVELRRCERPVC
jgi:hypothetical protein